MRCYDTLTISVFMNIMHLHWLYVHLSLTSEISEHKRQHLMIFMRALLTTTIGQCQVRAWNTKLATVGLYEPVMRLMTSSNVPKRSQLLVNDIHRP